VSAKLRMDKKEESRRQWEQDLQDLQGNITPERGMRGAQIIAKKAAAFITISDFAHLLRFLFGGILIAIGLAALNSRFHHSIILAAVAVAAGLFLALSCLRSAGSKKSRSL